MPLKIDNEKKSYIENIHDNSLYNKNTINFVKKTLYNKNEINEEQISIIPSYIENKKLYIIKDYNNNIDSQNDKYETKVVDGPQFKDFNQNETILKKIECFNPINTKNKIATEDKTVEKKFVL